MMGGSTIWRPQFGLVDKVRAELGLATKARDVVSDADVEDEEAPRIAQNDDDGAKKRKWSASMDGDDADVDEEEDDTATDDDDDGDDVDARWTRWTPEEDDVVVDMRSRGETYAAIARELSGRTAAAVQSRWHKFLENRQPDRAGAAWIPEEDAVIVSMKSRLDTYDAIAKELGRTTPALQNRWYKLKSLPRDPEGGSIADPSDSKGEDEDDDENEEEEDDEDDEDEEEDGSDEDADPSTTPHHVPEINTSTTVIPGLQFIKLVTSNGRFRMHLQHRVVRQVAPSAALAGCEIPEEGCRELDLFHQLPPADKQLRRPVGARQRRHRRQDRDGRRMPLLRRRRLKPAGFHRSPGIPRGGHAGDAARRVLDPGGGRASPRDEGTGRIVQRHREGAARSLCVGNATQV